MSGNGESFKDNEDKRMEVGEKEECIWKRKPDREEETEKKQNIKLRKIKCNHSFAF